MYWHLCLSACFDYNAACLSFQIYAIFIKHVSSSTTTMTTSITLKLLSTTSKNGQGLVVLVRIFWGPTWLPRLQKTSNVLNFEVIFSWTKLSWTWLITWLLWMFLSLWQIVSRGVLLLSPPFICPSVHPSVIPFKICGKLSNMYKTVESEYWLCCIVGMRWPSMTCQRWWSMSWGRQVNNSSTTLVTHRVHSLPLPTSAGTIHLLRKYDIYQVLREHL